ncbi:MAG: VWA domain-containing protein [Oscillospiraceae bacterium]|nr:VWA domain-containing protein [Oscillospiraceae bacterium]
MKDKMKRAYAALLLPAFLLCGCGSDASSEAMMSAPAGDPAPSTAVAEYSAEAADDGAAVGEATEKADYAPDAAAEEAVPAETAPDPDGEIPESQIESVTEPPPDDGSQPFVLTAGEWNDNENWGFFSNLVHSGTIAFPSYGLDPVHKISVSVTQSGAPAANQTVTLQDDDAVIWQAKTDRSGNAYLFYPANGSEPVQYTIHAADAAPVTCEIAAEKSGEQGGISVPQNAYSVEITAEPVKYEKTEVMFILDTTGSMGDEITYLQKDFSAIAGEVSNENMTFSVNFYKDEGDDYVTRCNPFTDDVTDVQAKLNQEFADGGGDSPEAVAQILTETITNGEWSRDTNKIAFLIFDAPPHTGTADAICAAAAAAAEKGIRIVPVVASNAERETELFGRALAIMTDSNYVFLTDDSGVGDSHLEPIIGSYQVELLHDIIVRNIREIAS